jgi:heptosyltransferase-2
LQWSLRRSIAKKLAANLYDVAYVLPNSFKSALIPWLAKINHRIGYLGEYRFGLINDPQTNPSRSDRPPMSLHYLQLLNKKAHESPYPKLTSSKEFENLARTRLEEQNINEFIVFCPGAEYGPAKQWPMNHFSSLANLCLEFNPSLHIVLLGSAKDFTSAQTVLEKDFSQRIHNWCGKTSLDEAMALIKLSKHVVTNDSGLMHISAALDKSLTAIFGSSDPRHTPPLSSQAKVHWLHLECSPCFKRNCPLGHTKCLNEISAKAVFQSMNLN